MIGSQAANDDEVESESAWPAAGGGNDDEVESESTAQAPT